MKIRIHNSIVTLVSMAFLHLIPLKGWCEETVSAQPDWNEIYLTFSRSEGTKIPRTHHLFLDGQPFNATSEPDISHRHIAYERDGNVILDDRDLGEGSCFSLYDDHIAFVRYMNRNGDGEVIYDGRDVGLGREPVVYGSHMAFCKQITTDPPTYHVIYDDEDRGEGCTLPGERIHLSEGHIAFVIGTKDHPHVIFDGHDMGEGEEIRLIGDHLAYWRPSPSYEWVYDGKTIGVPMPGVWMQGDHYAAEINHQIIHDGTIVGQGHGPRVYENHLAYFRGASVADPRGIRHVIYDGQDMGLGRAFIQLAGDHIVFDRIVNGRIHLILDGRDIGEGELRKFGRWDDYTYSMER